MRKVFTLGRPKPNPIPDKRKIGSSFYLIYSPKLGEFAECESLNELDNLVVHESDPNIAYLCPQPYQIKARVGGKKLVTMLDMLVEELDKTEYLEEVKPKGRLVKHPGGKVAPRNWPQVEAWANSVGANVRFTTDADLKKLRVRIESWMRALPYIGPSRPPPRAQVLKAVDEVVGRESSFRLSGLLDRLHEFSAEEVIASVVQRLHEGRFLSDMAECTFSRDTKIWMRADASSPQKD